MRCAPTITPTRSCAASCARPPGSGASSPCRAAPRAAGQRGARRQPAHTARTVPYVMDVNAGGGRRGVPAARVRRMIHGHTHRPGVHDAHGRRRTGAAHRARRLVRAGKLPALGARQLPAARAASLKTARTGRELRAPAGAAPGSCRGEALALGGGRCSRPPAAHRGGGSARASTSAASGTSSAATPTAPASAAATSPARPAGAGLHLRRSPAWCLRPCVCRRRLHLRVQLLHLRALGLQDGLHLGFCAVGQVQQRREIVHMLRLACGRRCRASGVARTLCRQHSSAERDDTVAFINSLLAESGP